MTYSKIYTKHRAASLQQQSYLFSSADTDSKKKICTALCDVCTVFGRSTDGYQRCADSGIFALCSPSCICDHVPIDPRKLNLHLPKKYSDMRSIDALVRVSTSLWWLCHNPVIEPLWSDYDSHILCAVSDFMAAYREERSLTRHDIETESSVCSLVEDTCFQMLTTAWYC